VEERAAVGHLRAANKALSDNIAALKLCQVARHTLKKAMHGAVFGDVEVVVPWGAKTCLFVRTLTGSIR
jgi:hypothetical protein